MESEFNKDEELISKAMKLVNPQLENGGTFIDEDFEFPEDDIEEEESRDDSK